MTNLDRMKKRLLPIPLILLIPIVLLVIVAVAGIYRFSLSDEEIMAKFPATKVKSDLILREVFDIPTSNPWTIRVPESNAFAFMKKHEREKGFVSGPFDDGVVRGEVIVETKWLTQIAPTVFSAPMLVSNQGSGIFYYLAIFEYDITRKRMILSDVALIGDRIKVTTLDYKDNRLTLMVMRHGEQQAMAEEPNVPEQFEFDLSQQYKLEPL